MLQVIALVKRVNSRIQLINVKHVAQTAPPVLTLQAPVPHVLDPRFKFLEPLVSVHQAGFTKQHESNAKLEWFAQMEPTMMGKTTVTFAMHVLTHALRQHPHRHACLHLLCKMVFALAQVNSIRVDFSATILLTAAYLPITEETTPVIGAESIVLIAQQKINATLATTICKLTGRLLASALVLNTSTDIIMAIAMVVEVA